jgi:serine/threonine-protein kinase
VKQIGPYRVQGELGRGAMGIVFQAFDQGGKQVALKLASDQASPTSLARLRREGELAARLTHPGIVRVHAAGEHHGRPWLAYELIEGAQTLDEVTQHLDREARLQILAGVADALAHAHACGVVHRDLKPQNILILADGTPKVADFGLAAARDLERMTQTGTFVGTPAYMAPEQFKGGPASPTADVWALGVLLYEALTDTLPFPPEEGLVSLLHEIMRAKPTKPSAHALVPVDLERFCLQALSREPKNRPVDGAAFAAAFALARTSPGSARWQTFAAAVGLALVAGLGVTAYALSRADGQPTPPATTVSQVDLAPPTPSAEATEPTPLTPAQISAGRKAARKLRAMDAPERRLEAASQWLSEYPNHPDGGSVEEVHAEARLHVPLCIVQTSTPETEGETHFVVARFLDDQRLVSLGHHDTTGTLRWWKTLASGLLEEWSAQPSRYRLRDAAPNPGEAGVLVMTRRSGLRRASSGVSKWPQVPKRGRGLGKGEGPAREMARASLATALSPDGQAVIAVASELRQGKPLSVRVGEQPVRIRPSWPGGMNLRQVALSQDGALLAVAGHVDTELPLADGLVRVHHLPAGKLAAEHAFEAAALQVELSASGRWLAVGLNFGRVVLGPMAGPLETLLPSEDANAGSNSQRVSLHGKTGPLAFSPAEDLIYTTGNERIDALNSAVVGKSVNELRVWATEDGRLVRRVALPFAPWEIDLSPDGRLLAVGGRHGELALYQAR